MYNVSLQQTESGRVEGGRKCLERPQSLIRSVPEDQVVGGYKEVHNTAGYVLYMVANNKLECLESYRPLLQNESRVLTTRAITDVWSPCETVDRAPPESYAMVHISRSHIF